MILISPVFSKSTSVILEASFFAYIPTDFFVFTLISFVFFTLAFFPASACANIPINDSFIIEPSALPKLIVPEFLALSDVPLFFANIPTASLFSKVIVPVDVFSPVPLPFPAPLSRTKIPTPFSAVTLIVLLFLTVPESSPNIPKDSFPLTFIVSLLSAIELVSFDNIPIPFSPDKVIVLLFVILEAFCPNIPIDSLLFTLIFPVFIPVALLAKIPIFFSLVADEDVKLIVPVFSANTFSFPTAVDSFTTIIPAEFLVLILISFLLVNDNLAVEAVTADFTFPNIPADVSSLTVIVPVVSFNPETVPPLASSISAKIPADVFFSVVTVPLFVAFEVPFLTYIPADISSFVVIELSFSMLALSPNIPADVFFSVIIVPLFVAFKLELEYIPTDSSSFVIIFPVVSFNKVELFFPNIPVAFLPFKVIIFLLVTVELSPAIPTIYSLLVPVIFPSFVNCEFASPYIPVE